MSVIVKDEALRSLLVRIMPNGLYEIRHSNVRRVLSDEQLPDELKVKLGIVFSWDSGGKNPNYPDDSAARYIGYKHDQWYALEKEKPAVYVIRVTKKTHKEVLGYDSTNTQNLSADYKWEVGMPKGLYP